MSCDGCRHLCVTKSVCRGVMDCDPPEAYCDLGYEDEEECNKYDEYDEYAEMCAYDDWLIKQDDIRNDR